MEMEVKMGYVCVLTTSSDCKLFIYIYWKEKESGGGGKWVWSGRGLMFQHASLAVYIDRRSPLCKWSRESMWKLNWKLQSCTVYCPSYSAWFLATCLTSTTAGTRAATKLGTRAVICKLSRQGKYRWRNKWRKYGRPTQRTLKCKTKTNSTTANPFGRWDGRGEEIY